MYMIIIKDTIVNNSFISIYDIRLDIYDFEL